MKKIRFLALALCLFALFSVCVAATEEKARDVSFENSLAADLKGLGLFSGVSENNFDLERVPTRTEVLVMLIRVLGEEKAALDGTWEHPFTDVPAWADKYVGYAYENGLTKGVSATKFGTDNASAVTYLTFMLRALGYSDAKGDFKWDSPFNLAKGLGILPSIVDTENFLRADIVTVSYAALSVNLKDSAVSLAEKLIEKEVFTSADYSKNYRGAKLTDKENEGKTVRTSEEIYENCAGAVALINSYDSSGDLFWNGSGFFIDECGMLVTTFYVISESSRIEVVLPETGEKYNVSGVYDYSGRYDWVILKVDGEGFKTLEINSMPAKGASTVYAIGSPEGLENTVSEGIISNVRQVVYDEYTYIQTTAPISDGSFGGPLVNGYGEVIGIVQDYDYDGQNLNFALPISVIANAKLDTVTPYGEYDWNRVWYYTDTDEVTVKAGEAAVYNYDYNVSTMEYDLWPEFAVTSSDNSVASAIFGKDYGTLRIVGNKAGEAEVVISDNISKCTHTVKVTVLENPDISAPKVTYTADRPELKLYNGAEKKIEIDITEYGISDEPNGNLFADYSVKSSNSKIKVVEEFAEDKAPYLTLTVKGNKDATGEIIVSNNKTGDTLVIPVTVGNRYESAYKELIESIKTDEGVVYNKGNAPEEECYSAAMESGTIGGGVYYYPHSGNVDFCVNVAENGATVEVMFRWTKDEVTEYSIAMNIMGIGIKYAGTIKNPETFGADFAKFKPDVFDCPAAYAGELLPQFNQMLASVIYALDVSFKYEFETFDMSDFGFIDIEDLFDDYEY